MAEFRRPVSARTALSIVRAGRSRSSRRPAESRGRRSRSTGAPADPDGERERRAGLAHARLRGRARGRISGIASSSSSCAVAISSSLVSRGSTPRRSTRATDASASPPNTSRLSNTHCIARPGRPMNGSSITRRSNRDVHVTIGDDAIWLARAMTSASAGGTSSKNVGQANHGTRGDDVADLPTSAPAACTPATASPATHDLRGRAGPDRAAGALDVLARRLARTSGAAAWSAAQSPPRAASAPNISARTRAKGRRRRLIGRLIERRDRQRIHSISRMRAVWPLRIEPVLRPSRPATRLSRSTPGLSSRRALFSGVAMPDRREAIAPRQRVPVEHAGREMKRRRQRRARQPRAHAGPVDHRHAELRLQAHVLLGADVAQERERLGVAAEQDVLPVVDELAGLAIRKRRRASAERARALRRPAREPRAGESERPRSSRRSRRR